MKAEQVDKALQQKFVTDEQRLVFWHDQDGAFEEYVTAGLPSELADVQVLDVAKLGGLSTKLLLEQQDTTGKYLVYSQGDAPDAEEDWLLDIRLYSAPFHADMASLWLEELGLSQLSIRPHLQARETFLKHQQRRKKLTSFLTPQDDEASIDLKMMAVLANSALANPFDVLSSLCDNHTKDGNFDLSEQPELIQCFEKMDLIDAFWESMQSEFGYTEAAPSIGGLLRRLFASELFHHATEMDLSSLAHYQLTESGKRNAVVFLTQWRDSNVKAASYDAAAAAISKEQKVREILSCSELDSLTEVFTFWDVELHVVASLKRRVLTEIQSIDVAAITEVASMRKAGHWLSGPGSEHAERQACAKAYDALVTAVELFALRTQHRQALSFDGAEDLLDTYQSTLYRFDQLYRQFCVQAKPAKEQNWDLLKDLSAEVEAAYDQGYLQPLGIEWSRLLDKGFLKQWSHKTLTPQQKFYTNHIQPHLAGSDRKRAFVIISDAFRYEAAQELTEKLNGTYRMNAELNGMLGVLPSYTGLGMASLLPHQTLSYNDKGEVLVDGQSSSGVSARSKQLATVDGMACKATDLLKMKTAEAREFTEGKRVVYIYHDVIDDSLDGDNNESGSFAAVDECISELATLIQFCTNKLNAAKIWLTADHGFLFQEGALKETDKSKLSHKPENTVKNNKRYLIGKHLGTSPEAHHGTLAETVGAEGDMEFWIPRAANRFNFVGGARFVHGGAMPQEVLVPLVTVSVVRDKKAEATRSEKVSVQILGNNFKITTPSYRFELIQTEAVSERRKQITLRAAVYEGSEPVTSIETLTFDSESPNIDERRKSIRLELRHGKFNKHTQYRLVLRDVESDAEVQSTPVIIDRSFDDDF